MNSLVRAPIAWIVAMAVAVAPILARAAGPPMSLTGMIFLASSGDVTELRVQADTGVIDESANKAHLKVVHADWAGGDGKPSLELTCDSGDLDLETNDLLANGDVHGVLADGRRFIGPSLRYDRARGVAYTNEPVQVIEDGRILSGRGFEYHVRDRLLRFLAGARVEENQAP